jgi:hypothetical protein
MFTYLWKDIYENLVVKSVGLDLISLLGSSASSSVDASSFGCAVNVTSEGELFQDKMQNRGNVT